MSRAVRGWQREDVQAETVPAAPGWYVLNVWDPDDGPPEWERVPIIAWRMETSPAPEGESSHYRTFVYPVTVESFDPFEELGLTPIGSPDGSLRIPGDRPFPNEAEAAAYVVQQRREDRQQQEARRTPLNHGAT